MNTKAKIIPLYIMAALCAAILAACSLSGGSQSDDTPSTSAAAQTEAVTEAPTEAPTKSEAEKTLEQMTLEQKAAQTVVAGIPSTTVDEEFEALADRGLGGVILFSDNITGAKQLAKLTNEIKSAADDIPLLIGMDEEGGRVTRLPQGVLSMPSAYTLAMSEDPKYVNRAGKNLGRQLKSFGLSTGFSPVLDIWSNPDNEVIGDRAFGTTADEVCTYGIEALKGIMSENVIAVAKHFPGHGDTFADSHESLPVITKTREELEKAELKPFEAAIDNGVPCIMAAHILCSKLDPNEPASLSKTIITDILKGDLGFDGVVFTDDLSMGAISEKYTPDKAAVKALAAGCDMLLVCFGYDNANNTIDAITNAVNDGTISKKRLDDAVLRILELKEKYDLSSDPVSMPDIDELNERTSEFLG